MLNTTGQMTTLQMMTPTGRAEHKLWLLEQIKDFTSYAKRNPEQSSRVMDIVEEFIRQYKDVDNFHVHTKLKE